MCAACGVHTVVDEMKDGCGLGQMKDGTIFGTKEADVRATSLCVRQSFDPFLSFRPLGLIINFETGIFGHSCAFAIATEYKYVLKWLLTLCVCVSVVIPQMHL